MLKSKLVHSYVILFHLCTIDILNQNNIWLKIRVRNRIRVIGFGSGLGSG